MNHWSLYQMESMRPCLQNIVSIFINVQGWVITTDFRVYQEFNLSSEWYTSIYKSWYKIKNIEVQWTVGFSWRSQFYLRIHDSTVNEWMYWYVFDYFNTAHRWELQLYSWSWSNLHTWSNNSIWSSNTYSITMWKNSGAIKVNWVTTNITYTATEQTRVSTIFNWNSPYFYVWTYNWWDVSYWTVKVIVDYEKV